METKKIDCGFYIFYMDVATNKVVNLPSKVKHNMLKEKEELISTIRLEFDKENTIQLCDNLCFDDSAEEKLEKTIHEITWSAKKFFYAYIEDLSSLVHFFRDEDGEKYDHLLL